MRLYNFMFVLKQKVFWIVWFGILKTKDIKISFEPKLEQDILTVLCFYFQKKYFINFERGLDLSSIPPGWNPST